MTDNARITDGVGPSEIRLSELASGAKVQHVRHDFGVGSTESVVTTSNPFPVAIYSALVPNRYDEITLSYSGSNISSVVYKLASATVATLTLSYSGSNLTSVVRS